MSRLEKFINEHRDEFDDKLPSEKVWQQVESSLIKKKGKRFLLTPFIKWSAAAAVLVIATVAALVIMKTPGKTEVGIAKTEDTISTDILALAPEEGPEMNQFAQLIASKQEELKIIAKEQPQLYQQFSKDIIQLDSSYNNLKNKLSVTPNRELLIEAMIQNLQLQLNVLNQQLNIIQQIKQSKKTGHEKNKIYS